MQKRSLKPAVTVVMFVAALTSSVMTSSSSPSTSGSTPATTAAPHLVVADATVTAGLVATRNEMVTVANAGGGTQARANSLEQLWASYEGTIKKNEPPMYIALEDAVNVFRTALVNKDTAKMAASQSEFAATATQYLAKHP